MNLTTADLAVKVAIEKAEEMGGKFSIAVLDGGVNLVAFSRMDGGRVGTIDVAMKKVPQFAGLGVLYILPYSPKMIKIGYFLVYLACFLSDCWKNIHPWS